MRGYCTGTVLYTKLCNRTISHCAHLSGRSMEDLTSSLAHIARGTFFSTPKYQGEHQKEYLKNKDKASFVDRRKSRAMASGGGAGGFSKYLGYLDPRSWAAGIRDAVIEYLFNSWFGEYLKEINRDKFKISFLGGEVTVYGLELKRGALDFLKLPIAVEEGILGGLQIVIPWNELSTKPVVVTINDLWVVAKPLASFDFTQESEEDLERKFKEKLQRLDHLQAKWEQQEAKRWGGVSTTKAPGIVERIVHTVSELIEVNVNHVHVMFEDITSHEEQPYTMGVAIDSIFLRSEHSSSERGSAVPTAGHKDMTKLIDIHGFRVYLNSEKVSQLRTFPISSSKLKEYSAIEHRQENYSHFDSEREAEFLDDDGNSASERLGETIATIFSMLRRPPVIVADGDGDARVSSMSDHKKTFVYDKLDMSVPNEMSGIVRPAPGDSFQRWSMLKEEFLDLVVQPIYCQLRYSINKDDIVAVDNPPKKALDVIFDIIDVELRESQFSHIRSFVLFINRYDRYDKYRRLARWHPVRSIHYALEVRKEYLLNVYKPMKHWYKKVGSIEAIEERKKKYGSFPKNWKELRVWGFRKEVCDQYHHLYKHEQKDEAIQYIQNWWHYAFDAVLQGLRENQKRAKWKYIEEYILRRSRYIEFYKRSRHGGKIWVIEPYVQKQLEEALGPWSDVRLDDPRLLIAARVEMKVDHGIPLSAVELDGMKEIEKKVSIEDIMLFRRIAEAQLQLEHYKHQQNLHGISLSRYRGIPRSPSKSIDAQPTTQLDLEGDALMRTLSPQEKADLFSYIKYDPKAEKLRVLPADYVMQHLNVIIKTTQIVFVTENGSKEELVATTTAFHVLRYPEVDRLEFSVGKFSIIDNSVVESKKALPSGKRREKRLAPPAELMNILHEDLRSKLKKSNLWHPSMLQVIRSSERFHYFRAFLRQNKRDQNLMFWIEVEHYERQDIVISHVELSPHFLASDREKLSKSIFSRFVHKKAPQLLSFGGSVRLENAFLKEQINIQKKVRNFSKLMRESADVIFKTLKGFVWKKLLLDFSRFIETEWNSRYYHFNEWCKKNDLGSQMKNEAILLFAEYREESSLPATTVWSPTRGSDGELDKKTKAKVDSAGHGSTHERKNTVEGMSELHSIPCLFGATSSTLDIANIISYAATASMIECLTKGNDSDVNETVEERHKNPQSQYERAPAIISVRLSIGHIAMNVTTEMVMRMGSFFLLYEKRLQSVVERTSTDVARKDAHEQREKTRAWKAFNESDIKQLLQKPNPLEIEVVTRGFEIRLPVEREKSGEKVVLYAVLLNCGDLEIKTSNSEGAMEVPYLLDQQIAAGSQYDMYDMKLPHLSIELVHFGDNVQSKTAFSDGGTASKTTWSETLVRVEQTRIRSYESRIPQHPEWPKAAVSIEVPLVISSFSNRGVEAVIVWFAYWNASWTALQESYRKSLLEEPAVDGGTENNENVSKYRRESFNHGRKSLSRVNDGLGTEVPITTKSASSHNLESKKVNLTAQFLDKTDEDTQRKPSNSFDMLKMKEKGKQIASDRAAAALERREEFILDLKCDNIDFSIVVRSQKMKLFTKDVDNFAEENHGDLELHIESIRMRQVTWSVRKTLDFGLKKFIISDYLSMDVVDVDDERQRKAKESNISDVIYILVLESSEDNRIVDGQNKENCLTVKIKEVEDISEQYSGEDEVITIRVPHVHITIPLKTVETCVKVYNSVDKALKTSTKTFMDEMSSIRRKFRRAKETKSKSLSRRKKKLTEASFVEKSHPRSSSAGAVQVSHTNERVALKVNFFLAKGVFEFKYDMKEALALLEFDEVTLSKIKYSQDALVFYPYLHPKKESSYKKFNGFDTSDASDFLPKELISDIPSSPEPNEFLIPSGADDQGETDRSHLTSPLMEAVTFSVKKIVAQGACCIDENSVMQGIIVRTSAGIDDIRVNILTHYQTPEKGRKVLEFTVNGEIGNTRIGISRKRDRRESSPMHVEPRDFRRVVSRNLLHSDKLEFTLEKERYIPLDEEDFHQIFSDATVRLHTLKIELDPLSLAAMASYQRQIERVIGSLKVKHAQSMAMDEQLDLNSLVNGIQNDGAAADNYDDEEDEDFDKEESVSIANAEDNSKICEEEMTIKASVDNISVLLLVPTNRFNTPRDSGGENDYGASVPDIEAIVCNLSETEIRIDILPHQKAKTSNISQIVGVTAHIIQLIDQTKVGVLHSHILDQIDDVDHHEPMLELKLQMPFHKSTSIHTHVDVKHINFVNLSRFLSELLAFTPWLKSAFEFPLHEDFLLGPPPPPNSPHFDHIHVKGRDFRIVMPKRSDTEEALIIFIGELTVENEYMANGVPGSEDVQYARFLVTCSDVEVSYRGFERLLVNRAIGNQSRAKLEPTPTNAVVLGAEDGLVSLVEADELRIQFDDLVTKYDRPRAGVLMGLWLTGENIVANMPEKAQKALEQITTANAREASTLIKVYQFSPPPKSNLNIKFGTPFAEVQLHETPDPCPVHYNAEHNLVYGVVPNPHVEHKHARQRTNTMDDFEFKRSMVEGKEVISKSLSSLGNLSEMSAILEKIGKKMESDGERKTAQVISQRGDGLVESSSDEIKGETSNLAQALHRIEQLESLNLKLKMEAENARKEQAEAELMFGKRLKAVSLKILDTVDTTATSLSKVHQLLNVTTSTIPEEDSKVGRVGDTESMASATKPSRFVWDRMRSME